MEGIGSVQGVIRSYPNASSDLLRGYNRYTPNKAGAPNKSYETPTARSLQKSDVGSDSIPFNPNYYSSGVRGTPQYKSESPKHDYSSIFKNQGYQSMVRSQLNPNVYDPEALSANEKELIMQLESVKKQRNYFETEYRRAVREYHERNLKNSQIQGLDNYGQESSNLHREINALKIQHQGESKRLNETISTLKLENAGLRNLRSILEGEIETLKNVKQQADSYKDRITKLEVENTSLRNQSEAANSLLKAKIDEFQGFEKQYKAQINEKNGILQALRDKISQNELFDDTRIVLFSIEVERLHTVIDDLYSKINGLQLNFENELQRANDEFRIQQESNEAEIRASQNRAKDLERMISDNQAANKKLREEIDRMKLQESELEKDIQHWKERYKIIEGSHKYLVDAIEKIRAGSPSSLKGIFPATSQQFPEFH